MQVAVLQYKEMMPSIAVKVRYNNILRSAAGLAEETVRIPAGASLLDLLRQLGDRHGSRLLALLFDAKGGVVTHLVIFRNQKLVPQGQYELQLAEGDELMLFPAVSGG
jgi:molybdopterin converting factor small subunit